MRPRTTYRLGALVGEQQYIYTALPEQLTLDAAITQQSTRSHRSTSDVVFCYRPAIYGGVHYGYEVDIRSALDGALLIPWRAA